MTATFHHIPVLLQPVIDALAPVDGGVYVDCTLGGGGHTEALLKAADCRVIGLDRDPAALAAAGERLRPFGERFTAVRTTFDRVRQALDELGIDKVDGLLADFGVSSHQLDTADRGFSFRHNGPVDMRMDPDAPYSAADLVNDGEQSELERVIRDYGEERRWRRVARAIVDGRPWQDTAMLAAAVEQAVGGKYERIHKATRTFQGLRIAVNDELGQVERLLTASLDCVAPGGHIALISFHSLEDRLVKRFFYAEAGRTGPRDAYGHPIAPVRLGELALIRPDDDDPNPRARSSRLRIATRLP